MVVTEDSCMTAGGVWYSDWDSCDPNPCPAVCCLGDESCLLVSQDSCLTLAGEWHPEWDSCDPNPCGALVPSDVEDSQPVLTALLSIHPNPFTGTTEICFALAKRTRVSVRIYDAAGRVVRTLTDRVMEPGRHLLEWNGETNGRGRASVGIYLCTFRADGIQQSRKMFSYR
jgi:hypothetical protein